MKTTLYNTLIGITLFLFSIINISAQTVKTVSATYNAGDIPTSYSADLQIEANCNGPATTLSITLPLESYPIQIINAKVEYDMTALSNGNMSDQRSKIYFQTKSIGEPWVNGEGIGNGTFSYSRDIKLSNGVYNSGDVLTFEMWALRIYEDISGCNTAVNKVDNNTWTITLEYIVQEPIAKVGVGTDTPSSALDIAGKIKVGNDYSDPFPGQIMYDTEADDFKGYTEKGWISLTDPSGRFNNYIYTSEEPFTLPKYEGVNNGGTPILNDTIGLLLDSGGEYSNYSGNDSYTFYSNFQTKVGFKYTILELDIADGDILRLIGEGDIPNDLTTPFELFSKSHISFYSTNSSTGSGFKIKYEVLFEKNDIPSNSDKLEGGWRYNFDQKSIYGGYVPYPFSQNDSMGLYSLNWGNQNATHGLYSIAIGSENSSYGNYSSTWGERNSASNSYSIAFGNENSSTGVGSIVWGYDRDSESASYFTNNRSTGHNSTVWGIGNIGSGKLSTVWGKNNSTSGDNTTVLGENNSTQRNFCTIWGRQNFAQDSFSTIWGENNTANEEYSTVWGTFNNAAGAKSTTWGELNTASGSASTSWGGSNTASGISSTSWGYSNTALGYSSTSWGELNTASGYGSTSWGSSNNSLGTNSTSWGTLNTASGQYSTAIGLGNEARAYGSLVIGTYNYLTNYNPNGTTPSDTYDRLFEIGNGNFNARSNALTVLRNGNIGTQNITNPLATLHLGYTSGWDAHLRLEYDNATNEYGNIVYDWEGMKFKTWGTGDNFIFRNKDNVTLATFFENSNMTIGGTLTQNSDRRLKKSIIPVSNSLQKIKKVIGYNYYWKESSKDTSLQTGLIAQDINEIFPELVIKDDDSFLSVNYLGLIPHLIEAVKELSREKTILEVQVANLESNQQSYKEILSRLEKLENNSKSGVNQSSIISEK